MKKLKAILILVLTFCVIYFLQINVFSYVTIRGIKPNLFVIYIALLGLFLGKRSGIITGMILGLLLDILTGDTIGGTSIMLGLVGLATEYIDDHYSKDSLITFIAIMGLITIFYETGTYIFRMAVEGLYFNISAYLKIVMLETLYNVLLTIIFYPLIKKIGYYVQNIYKKKKLLTRYF